LKSVWVCQKEKSIGGGHEGGQEAMEEVELIKSLL